MPHLITAITYQQHVLIVIFSTPLTWLLIAIIFHRLEEYGGVNVGNLGAVFDNDGGHNGA
jgi:hypothetical protein